MGANSSIEWTHHTFNPWHECVEVSPACDHCYARELDKRFPILGKTHWGKEAPRRFFGDAHWAEPLKWDREAAKAGERRRVFCGSMCDVMEDRSEFREHRMRLYALIDATPNLDWLLLSKRPQNYRKFLTIAMLKEPRPNIWILTTVESEEQAWRIKEILQVPAVVHGVSYEPALGPVNFTQHAGLDWIIAGGESGSKARPPHPNWMRYARDQCLAAGVAFFFKQWGEWSPISRTDGYHELPFMDYQPESRFGYARVGKKEAGNLLDGVTWQQFPTPRAL